MFIRSCARPEELLELMMNSSSLVKSRQFRFLVGPEREEFMVSASLLARDLILQRRMTGPFSVVYQTVNIFSNTYEW